MNAVDKNDQAALHLAVAAGHLHCVESLVNAKANLNLQVPFLFEDMLMSSVFDSFWINASNIQSLIMYDRTRTVARRCIGLPSATAREFYACCWTLMQTSLFLMHAADRRSTMQALQGTRAVLSCYWNKHRRLE